jgi:hypothetical protein
VKAIAIYPQEQTIQEIEIEMQANTLYSFFNSILIDDVHTLQHHTIYADANALSEVKKPFFLGEQLLIGDALILGNSNTDVSAPSIPLQALKDTISYDVNEFYRNALLLLSQTDINLYRPFNVLKDAKEIALSLEWVLYTFNIADERTQEYFLKELANNISSTEMTESYIQKMALLALQAA